MARQNEHTRAEELISAYLDQRVTAEDKQFFERHIASCADCRAQLESTRSMIAALKAMPAVKAPRSFVLPRETAKQPRRTIFDWYPALRLATVVAAVVFMIVFAGDLLTTRSAGQPVSMSIPAAAPVNQAAPMAPSSQDSTAASQPAPAPLMAEQAPAPTAAATASAAGGVPPAAKAMPSENASASEPMTATANDAQAATDLAAMTATPEATAIAAASQAKRTAITTPVPESASAAEGQTTASAVEQAVPTTSAAAAPAFDPWRIVEIALLVLIGVLAVATVIARRKQI